MRWWGFLAASGSACTWLSAAELEAYQDRDGDGEPGHRWGGDDCDDGDRSVRPGTQFADTPTVFYVDQDEDGLGGVPTAATCVQPPGTVPEGGDCDDQDGAVQRLEQYVDGDGDGVGAAHGGVLGCTALPGFSFAPGDCDDGDPEVATEIVWYGDDDGDGAGAPVPLPRATDPCLPSAVPAWTTPVTDGGDCDDTDPEVFPGAPGERGFDGVDTDCDGATDVDGDEDGAPDFVGVADCRGSGGEAPTDPEHLAADVLGPGCAHLVLAPGIYAGELVLGRTVTLRAAAPGTVVFRPGRGERVGIVARSVTSGGGTAPIGVTLEDLRFEGFPDGFLAIDDGTSVLLDRVEVEQGGGFSFEGPPRTGLDPTHGLLVLGSRFDGVNTLLEVPGSNYTRYATFELRHVDVVNAIATGSLVSVGADRGILEHVRVSDCAVLDAVFRLAGSSPTLRHVTVEHCLAEAAVASTATGVTTLDDVTIADNQFVDSALARVGIDLLADVSFHAVRLERNRVEGGFRPGAVRLMAVDGAVRTGSRGLLFQDNTLPDGTLLELVSPLPHVLSDVAFAVSGPGVPLTSNGPLTLDHATFVGDRTTIDLLGLGVLTAPTATRSVFSAPPPDIGLAISDSLFLGAPPDACRPTRPGETCCDGGCRREADPGFLRFDPALDPASWDLRFVRPSHAPCGPAPDAPALSFDAGALHPDTDPELYADRDADGLLDDWEEHLLGSVLALPDADDDGDGLLNQCELEETRTRPDRADTDGDGVDDDADGAPLDPGVD